MKPSFIISIIAGLLIVGGGIYFISRNPSDSVPTNQTEVESSQTTVNTQNPQAATQSSMKELVARGESLECSFAHDVGYSRSSGVVYIADGKLRGNFSITVASANAQTFEAYMIADGDNSLVWSSLIKQGFKIPISKTEPAQGANQGGVDYNQKLDYSCKPWSRDLSVFVPPAGITFSQTPAVQ